MTQVHKIELKIADFNILIYTENENLILDVDTAYETFVVSDCKSFDSRINIVQGIPQKFSENNFLFKAPLSLNQQKNSDEYLWSINMIDNQYIVTTSKNKDKTEPNLVAVFQEGCKEITIYIAENSANTSKTVFPLEYPMGPLLLYYIALFNNAFMIHASGISDKSRGLLFTGFSGIGKSTMASLWLKNGAKLINDDRLIVRKIKDKYFMYNTPMYYKSAPQKSELTNLFILKQTPVIQAKKLTGAMAVSRLMAFCIQHDFEQKLIEKHLDMFSDLCTEIPLYELGFSPNEKVVKFIRENEF